MRQGHTVGQPAVTHHFPKVVDEAACREEVHGRHIVWPRWIVMVAVDSKNRQADVEVGVCKVHEPAPCERASLSHCTMLVLSPSIGGHVCLNKNAALWIAPCSSRVAQCPVCHWVSEVCSPVGKVGGLVAQDLDADGSAVQAVFAQDLHGPHQARLRRLVVMKQVSSQEHKVHLHLFCNLEDLLKGIEGVVLPHLILLPDALYVHRTAVSAASACCGL